MKKQNIIFILADQLRADFCGCYGADFVKTPHIDMLASEGVLYLDAVSPSPTCVPARASLMTGKCAIENRVLENSHWLRPDRDKMGIKTWPEQLSEEGYKTAAIGKMHFYPWDIREGFEHRVIAEDKRHIGIEDDYTYYLKKHGYKRLHGKEHDGYYDDLGAIVSKIPHEHNIDRFIANETCNYLDNVEKDRPFALMVGFAGPHCPYDPSAEQLERVGEDINIPLSIKSTKESDMFLDQNINANKMSWNGVDISKFTEEKKKKIRKHYIALLQEIDENIGNIIKKLKEINIYDETIIIFSSDHGDYLGDYNMAGKGHFYNSSCHVPLIVKNNEKRKLIVNHTVSLTDIYSSILHFAGLKINDTSDSTVLAPFGGKKNRERVFGCNDWGWMIRDANYLYTNYFNGLVELYDLQKDKHQTKNLIGEEKYKDIAIMLHKELLTRVFGAINRGNSDMIAKANNLKLSQGVDKFNFEGWQRPYPFCQAK